MCHQPEKDCKEVKCDENKVGKPEILASIKVQVAYFPKSLMKFDLTFFVKFQKSNNRKSNWKQLFCSGEITKRNMNVYLTGFSKLTFM